MYDSVILFVYFDFLFKQCIGLPLVYDVLREKLKTEEEKERKTKPTNKIKANEIKHFNMKSHACEYRYLYYSIGAQVHGR